MQAGKIDIAILGGGLAGGLIALALARLRPELSLAVAEQGQKLGGNHLWSCFDSDLPQDGRWLTGQLEARRWPGYEVHFPGHSRVLGSAYATITSDRLDAVLRERLPPQSLLTGAEVAQVEARGFTLADGTRIAAGAVIDARGMSDGMPHMAGGWQKFGGRMLRLAAPHGLTRPIVMDARVEQLDGYRFVYCLPFSETEVFVEDTYYSGTPDLDRPAIQARIDAYAAAQGWKIDGVTREETGVLPVIGKGSFDAFWREGFGARAGARAALVHPLTSYSLPQAVRFALRIAGLRDLSAPALAAESEAFARQHWQQTRFYRKLARMLMGAPAERRYRVLERFYKLPEPVIERFYAGETTQGDRRRVLIGRPPVPILGAIASMAGWKAMSPLSLEQAA